MRMKGSWFVVDKEGVILFAKVTQPQAFTPPNDNILQI